MKLLEPIKLLIGHHDDTGKTGQGCFMNVIAYLNGEPQITDKSPCVCVSVRSIAIWLNDVLLDGERRRLIPYIERAMGSATTDKAELRRRGELIVVFAQRCADLALSSEPREYWARHKERLESVKRNASRGNLFLAAEWAASCANVAYLPVAIKAAFEFLDAALPPAQPYDQSVIDRANELIAISREMDIPGVKTFEQIGEELDAAIAAIEGEA